MGAARNACGTGKRPMWRVVLVTGLVVGLAPSVARAQYGRDAVMSRVVELARRDAPSATLVGIVESGRLAQGQDASRAYRLQGGTCYWFFGAGDGNVHDLDVMVSHRGVVVVRDQSTTRDVVVPGERPYCPGEEQRVQVRVVAFRGGGLYATALYAASPPSAASGSGAVEQNAQARPGDVTTLLDRAAVRYAPGMGQSMPPVVRTLTEAEDLTSEVRLTGGMCYRFLAVGGEGVQDLGLNVYQGASEIGRDNATSSEAVAAYCTTADTTVRVRLRMVAGNGEVAFASYAGGSQPGVQRQPSTLPTVDVGGDGDDYLARQIRAHHGRVGEGRQGVSQVQRARLRASEDRVFPLTLEGGRCYTIIAVGAPSVRDLDLYLIAPNGMEQNRDDGPTSFAVVRTDPCPRWNGTYSVRVRVFAGYGDVAMQAFGN